MVNSPLIRPYFLGGVALGGVPLDSHDDVFHEKSFRVEKMHFLFTLRIAKDGFFSFGWDTSHRSTMLKTQKISLVLRMK